MEQLGLCISTNCLSFNAGAIFFLLFVVTAIFFYIFIQKNPSNEPEVDEESGGVTFSSSANFSYIIQNKDAIEKFFYFLLIIAFVYTLDGGDPSAVGSISKSYSRDSFFAVIFLSAIISYYSVTDAPSEDSIIQKNKMHKILNRNQTEEWRGWMQIAFIFYHYFNAKEVYNLIRVLVSSYVWMTGFGNFSYFWIRKDYSLLRFVKMMFRLNFFVIFLCLALDNEFMLYYICALHAFWFVAVFATMGIFPESNYNPKIMKLKFVILFLVIVGMYQIPGLFNLIWFAFTPILGINGDLHEWEFRSKLDHLIPIWGMICAYNYPTIENWLENLEKKPEQKQREIKFGITFVTLIVLYVWTTQVLFIEDKFEYNAIHPYTSWIPITCYMILRNLFATLRAKNLAFFGFVGKITLETYLCQFHIWLSHNSKQLLAYFPDYFWVNLIFASLVYIFISKNLFTITIFFSDYFFPAKNTTSKMVLITLTKMSLVLFISFFFGYLLSNFNFNIILLFFISIGAGTTIGVVKSQIS